MRKSDFLAVGSLIFLAFISCQKDESKASIETLLSKGNDLAWSRDGSKLAIISNDSLFIINKDGKGKKLIATSAYSKPSWSVSDEFILYQGLSSYMSVLLVKSDGSGSRVLADKTYNPYLPEWSPDGQKISFV